MTEAPEKPGVDTDTPEWSVELDIQITRRRRAHSILNPAGEAVWHAAGIGEVIRWLADQDVSSALFIEPEGVYRIGFQVLDTD